MLVKAPASPVSLDKGLELDSSQRAFPRESASPLCQTVDETDWKWPTCSPVLISLPVLISSPITSRSAVPLSNGTTRACACSGEHANQCHRPDEVRGPRGTATGAETEQGIQVSILDQKRECGKV